MDSTERWSAGTAHWTAAARAKETRRPDRLFEDPFAETFAGPVGRLALEASERRIGGENPFLPIRTRWFDDVVLGAVRADSQVVVLGAGFDARPMRLAVPPSVRWFELDRPETLHEKERLLEAAGAAAAGRRTPVPVDLAGRWSPSLVEAGLEVGRPTLWLAEGVLMYLDDAGVDRLLGEVRRLSGPSSSFAADVFSTPLATSSDQPSGLFCTSDPRRLLGRAGWSRTLLIEPWQLAYARERLTARPADPHPASGRAWFVAAHS